MFRILKLTLLLGLLCGQAFAQRAVILQMPGGQLLGIAYTPAGQVILTEITIIRLDNPTPPPKPDPTAVAEQLIVLRDQRTATTQQVALLLDLQEKYQRGTKPELFVLDRTDPGAAKFLALKPPGDAFPYYFLAGAGGKVLNRGPVPTTLAEMTATIDKFKGVK